MKVKKTKDLGGGHLVEVGSSTWDEYQTSIRNRYQISKGGLSNRGLSEISLDDVFELMIVAADEDLLEAKKLAKILSAVSASLQRKI